MSEPRNPIEMVDISAKPVIARLAEAQGEIRLLSSTINAINQGTIKKGDVFTVAEIAGILAAKKTAEILPLCHSLPLLQVNMDFTVEPQKITARCVVSAKYKTGVEMEALLGVSTSLLTIWDMVKYLEKDEEGQYPHTRIQNIRVTKKWKNE